MQARVSASGRQVLGQRVMLENAHEAAEFLKAHGVARIRGPIGVRRLHTALEVDVELTGKDGKTLVLVLMADGSEQGVG